jgi:CheY-like chemotaxis protein
MLVLSSNRTKLGIISAYASAWGCTVATFETTERATSYLSTLSDSPDFNIVLIDSQLEDTHFSTALAELRKSRHCEKSSALLLVPHLGQEPAHIEKHIEFSGVLAKPIRLAQFRSVMKRAVLGSKAEADPGPTQTSGAVNLGLKVLLAEDNLVNAFVASRRLEDWQCAVTIAENGADALKALESESFDVVLMDISMPVMDGLQATKEIRQREESSGLHIPIIAITAYALKGDRERCLAAGMDDYMAKPINFSELLEKLRYWAYHS